ncbi:DUF317 domain-containing protein, partial [Peterkaempfera griseoplana]|uniref:DUF317 domain-containing protein n=1 Tax=Peterkaempfera griseoplana TaxID=66896 RepID=UPI0006E37167
MIPASTAVDEPDGDVYVSPRYLAGSTGIGDPGLQPLRDIGGALSYDDLGNCYLATPDQRIRAGFIPEQEWNTLWQIAVSKDAFAPPLWCMNFSEHTPEEIVADVTTVLAALYEPDGNDWLIREPRTPGAWRQPYLDAGWTTHPLRYGQQQTVSPDGHATMTWRMHPLATHEAEQAGQDGRWTLAVDNGLNSWYGRFSSATPDRILTAAATAMLNPAPVPRYRHHLGRTARQNATLTPIAPPVPTPRDVHRQLAARTHRPGLVVQEALKTPTPTSSLAWTTITPVRTN